MVRVRFRVMVRVGARVGVMVRIRVMVVTTGVTLAPLRMGFITNITELKRNPNLNLNRSRSPDPTLNMMADLNPNLPNSD